MSTDQETSFQRQCFYVWAGIENGRLVRSVGTDSTDPEFDAAAVRHVTSEMLVDLEIRFDLSDILDSTVESYELEDRALDSRADPIVKAIEAELQAMLAKIATLRFREVS